MTKRRPKGEGSVYRRKDGRVVGEYIDANGKRRYVSGKTKAEARAKLRKAVADTDAGIAFDSENLTVELNADRWLVSIRASVRESTILRSSIRIGEYLFIDVTRRMAPVQGKGSIAETLAH